MLAASIAPTTQAAPSSTSTGPAFTCMMSFSPMGKQCVGTTAATIAQFKSLQTLVNQAMLKGNYNGSYNGAYIGVPGGQLLTVNGAIDENTRQALVWLSNTFGGVLAIYDVSFTPDYIAQNVANITNSLLTFLGVSFGARATYNLRQQAQGSSVAQGQSIMVVSDPGPTVNTGVPTPDPGTPAVNTGGPADPVAVTGGGGQGTQVTPVFPDGQFMPGTGVPPTSKLSTYAVIGVGLGIVAALFGLHHG